MWNSFHKLDWQMSIFFYFENVYIHRKTAAQIFHRDDNFTLRLWEEEEAECWAADQQSAARFEISCA